MTFTKTLHSFSGLRTAFNLPERAAKGEKPRKCRICGEELEHIPGTNVYVCHGKLEVPDPEGKGDNPTKEVECTNVVLARP